MTTVLCLTVEGDEIAMDKAQVHTALPIDLFQTKQ